ncbi:MULTISPECIES: divergent PAP2 family protein [Heyndrickxia]|uniref:Divergent PAP2 family protein n=2 Tax=Heyndrickxia TaxID=2837504 RepID=A0AB37HGB8_9BACI|nr:MULTISPECIES: divergent PAP2 family protein [Heyndrickxia]MBL5768351.1 divergent PAP2 family protein [Heyndrickxia sporothermodurans]MBL5771974.1 divergent PAP2 family protein [Heyndrickxia sporothermodurans]MBL5775582.1 divergent PAP2 family protein [Heyndrickxia sporothermodurans]MBL5779141.1 divergent PAP2 family protein [Heyndrickxia sporothermodurans]MBL5783412.1 divergent PAP2 family protein [Heyndrickxia sporothermodurans]
MFLSYPILAALLGMLIAQFVKIPIHFLTSRELKWSLFLSTGGMPSSHTATVISLTTAIGLTSGFYSNEFAICVVVSAIVIHDAIGVRREAGFHAEVLNKLLADFNQLIEIIKDHDVTKYQYQKKFKELLGHKPVEVFFGIITGILVGLLTFYIYPF